MLYDICIFRYSGALFGNMSGKKLAAFLKTAKLAVSELINRGGGLAAKSGITVFPNNVPEYGIY